jgi:hypothetical protein
MTASTQRPPRPRKERDEQTAKEYFLEQAAAYFDEMKSAAKNAPHGQVINSAEAVVLSQGRELLRQSLEIITQEEVDEIEKKNETRLCPKCQGKKRHRGSPSKKNETAAGTITVERRYDECIPCRLLEHVVDDILGLGERYTLGIRRLIVRAGGAKSFAEAEEDLFEYCGLKVSHMTVRELCQQEAVKMAEWQNASSEVQKDFAESPGNVEVTMDGTSVNTTEGWREVKVGIASKREWGDSALPEEWDTRRLPRHTARVAFAAIEGREAFQERFQGWRRHLRLGASGDISTLGDGAPWIGNISSAVFGNVRECLDIYHVLEHLSDTSKALYGNETDAQKKWYEESKSELLSGGFEGMEPRLHRTEKEKKWDSEQKENLRLLHGYLENNRERLGYRQRLEEGRAIGSGQVEGACKSMIGIRLKQTGAKWLTQRLNRMTVLCSVRYSSHWKKYWNQTK